MASPWIAGLVALVLWWTSTGAILYVVRRADLRGGDSHLLAVLAGLPVLALGWLGLLRSAGDPSVAGVYTAFVAALAVWGWFELAFLAGIITGPNTRPCPQGVPGWERFLRAWGTIAYAELALLLALVAIAAVTAEGGNRIGLWTFALLFAARISAKLNVWLGVPNINAEFLPVPMRHLESHFRIAPMNGFFPVAVTALTLAAASWLARALAAEPGSGEAAGHALLAALAALALLEHWFMVLPLPDARLWRWMLPKPAAEDPAARPEPDF